MNGKLTNSLHLEQTPHKTDYTYMYLTFPVIQLITCHKIWVRNAFLIEIMFILKAINSHFKGHMIIRSLIPNR